MRYSKLFGQTQKTAPKEAQALSHQLLIRAGFIDRSLAAGIYTLLPLGWRVFKKIENIIREEINAINGQELFMPSLHPKALWQETKRWQTYDPPLFKLKDRHQREYCLAPTHEEVVTDLARRFIKSYQDLPKSLYQIQNKFRNEMRPTGGLLRTREFMMKDLYSFHASQEDLDQYYGLVVKTYLKIFKKCGLEVKVLEADSGAIGGTGSHEFGFLCPTGEDKIYACQHCPFAANIETTGSIAACPKCQNAIVVSRCIENGHTFKLETLYSGKMKAEFTDKSGQNQPLWMGCYGIGLGRLLATIVETHHDQRGIIWPKSVAPFQAHLIDLTKTDSAQKIYDQLTAAGLEVLFDDRPEISIGEKFADADLIGCPYRLVVSSKTGRKIELKKRNQTKTQLSTIETIIRKFKV